MHHLGAAHEEFAGRVDALWREAVGPQWRERHEYAVKSRRKLAALDEKAAAGQALSPDEMWQRAYWTAEFVGPEAAEPRLRELLERSPDNAPGNLALGQTLLERGDESGAAFVERAMEADPGAVPPGCEMLYAFLRERGREEEAEAYRRRLLRHFETVEQAEYERNVYNDGDELLPHGLAAEEVEALRAQLRKCERVERAYLARKRVEHFASRPVYVLAVETEEGWRWTGTAEADAEILQSLSHPAARPGDTFFVFILKSRFVRTKRALQEMDGALIYGD